MSRTRKAQGRDDFVHLLRQVHRTETREVTEKVAMMEVQKAHQNLLVQTSRKEGAKGESHVIIGMFANVQNSKFQVDAKIKTGVHTNTHKNLLMQRNIQHTIAIHIPSNDERRVQIRKIQSDDKTHTEWDFIMSRTSTVSKEYLGRTLGVIQTGSPKSAKPKTLRHSRKDLSNGL